MTGLSIQWKPTDLSVGAGFKQVSILLHLSAFLDVVCIVVSFSINQDCAN